MMLAGIARHAKILVIAGDLPVGEGLLSRRSPHQRRGQYAKKEQKEKAHEWHNPGNENAKLGGIFVAQPGLLNQIYRIDLSESLTPDVRKRGS
ncbi:protein of unknown function [Enterobacter cancerogenus]|nr:protein of unknown function [Enterobacter cancerogenus]